MPTKIVITANGEGSRMKGLSPFPKHELYYGDKKIIEHLLDVFPSAEVLTGYPSKSRRETLDRIRDYTDTLIVDCDVIPPRELYAFASHNKNFLFYFKSNKEKYSSLEIRDQYVYTASENVKISDLHCSGLYFVKSVSDLLDRMADNSIAFGMIGASVVYEDDFIKLGDPEDYYEALGIHNDCFTDNHIMLNRNTVIKFCKTGETEKSWYYDSKAVFNTPQVEYADDELIVLERIFPTSKPTADDFVRTIKVLKDTAWAANGRAFITYLNNLPPYEKPLYLPEHKGTFFHGDLSTHNVLKNSRLWLIDPNYKNIFGSWLTDAGKAAFSFIAYEKDYPSAKHIADTFGPEVWNFAVAEGLRVTKYKPEYRSIVNNIYEIYLKYGCLQ